MQPSPPTPPHITGPQKPKSGGLFFVFLTVGLLVFLLVLFFGLWQFLSPTERRVIVPYSQFLAEVHDGRVEEIRVHDRDIDYRLRQQGTQSANRPPSVIRHTVGPVADQAFLDSLKPTDPTAIPPKVTFEK